MLQLREMLHNQPLRIFDAAAGWGDRLIAAMVVDAERYVGVDPNSNSKPCFDAAVEAIKGRDAHAKYVTSFAHCLFVTSCAGTRFFATVVPGQCSPPTAVTAA